MGYVLNRKVRKMAKLNPTTMKTQYDGQYDTFCRKNHDYGNSFEESLDQFGIIASLVRMQDKMLRLQSLTDESKTQQVGSESLLDTLEDLSNYAAMTACWLKGVQAEDDVINKSYHETKKLIEMSESLDELPVPDELFACIKENVDDCVNRIWQLSERGELPTIGGIEHYTYNIGRLAINYYEDPYKVIEHIAIFPSFRVLSDNNARMVVDSIKNYIKEYIKEKEESELTEAAYDFLEDQITRAAAYMGHIRMHGRTPENKDIGDYAYDIARYALEQYPDPYRILQHMGQILVMRSLNPNDALLLCGRVTDYIRERSTKEKGCNKAKAKDKAYGAAIKGGRGNGKFVLLTARGSGKGLAKTRALMEELGVPKETIKEIFEDLEADDEE